MPDDYIRKSLLTSHTFCFTYTDVPFGNLWPDLISVSTNGTNGRRQVKHNRSSYCIEIMSFSTKFVKEAAFWSQTYVT